MRIDHDVNTLLLQDRLSESALLRAEEYFRRGDLSQLIQLPLAPAEMIQAAEVLLNAPSNHYPSASSPSSTLSVATRQRLRSLVEEDGIHAEAALFVLTRDLRARALNLALARTRWSEDGAQSPRRKAV